MEEDTKKGIVCICLSALGFSLMAMFVRMADNCGEPLPAIQKAFFRNLVACAIACSVLFRNKAGLSGLSFGLQPRQWMDLVLRSSFGTAGIFANFYAISHIPIADAIALNKTAPFFTLVFSWLLVGERMGLRQTLCVLGAFAGALFVIKPGLSGSLTLPSAVGLLSGFCAGAAYAFLHRLGKAGVNGAFIILFFSAFSCISCVPFIAADYHAMNPAQLLALAGAGACAAIGQFGITWAYRLAEPRQVAVFDYSGIIFSAILGFAAFGQIPDGWSFLGFAVIIAMAAVLNRRKPE